MSDIHVSILEDEKQSQDHLISCLKKYEEGRDISFCIHVYSDAEEFLSHRDDMDDIVFLDIELPGESGMQVAHEIRKTDKDVIIVFVTNLAQYAIEGYEVDAYDFVLKPFTYEVMELKFQRLVNLVSHRKSMNDEKKVLSINLKNQMKFIPMEEIVYIEVYNHDLIIHLSNDEKIRFRGTMSAMCERLKDSYFCLCNSCYLVNLAFVDSVLGDMAVVKNDQLKISQSRRKEFIQKLASYMGGSI